MSAPRFILRTSLPCTAHNAIKSEQEVLTEIEALIDQAFEIEARLRKLQGNLNDTGKKHTIEGIVLGYHACNDNAESAFRSIDGT